MDESSEQNSDRDLSAELEKQPLEDTNILPRSSDDVIGNTSVAVDPQEEVMSTDNVSLHSTEHSPQVTPPPAHDVGSDQQDTVGLECLARDVIAEAVTGAKTWEECDGTSNELCDNADRAKKDSSEGVPSSASVVDGVVTEVSKKVEGETVEPDVDVNEVIRDLDELNQIAKPVLQQTAEMAMDVETKEQETETFKAVSEDGDQRNKYAASMDNLQQDIVMPNDAEDKQVVAGDVDALQQAPVIECNDPESKHNPEFAMSTSSSIQVTANIEAPDTDKNGADKPQLLSDKQTAGHDNPAREELDNISDPETVKEQSNEKSGSTKLEPIDENNYQSPEVMSADICAGSDDISLQSGTVEDSAKTSIKEGDSDDDVSFVGEEPSRKFTQSATGADKADAGGCDDHQDNSDKTKDYKSSSTKVPHCCIVCSKELTDNEQCCKADSKEGFLNLLTLTSRESAMAVAESQLAKSEANQVSILPSVKQRKRRAPVKLEDEMELVPRRSRNVPTGGSTRTGRRGAKSGKSGTSKSALVTDSNSQRNVGHKAACKGYGGNSNLACDNMESHRDSTEVKAEGDSHNVSTPGSIQSAATEESEVLVDVETPDRTPSVQSRSHSSLSGQDVLSDGETGSKKRAGRQKSVEPIIIEPIDESSSESIRRSKRDRKLTEKAANWVATRQNQDEVPIISDVVSLAQKVPDITSPVGSPLSTAGSQMTHIIIQPPKPRHVKNKALLCKPFYQTKATSCRPHTQSKGTQTDFEPKQQKALLPVPVPIYVPTPMAMYAAPQPYPIPIPVPIPIPCFIPTTKKSADAILKQIKEIREQMPADPFEAELLMMAEAVASAEKSESDTSDGEDDDAEEAVSVAAEPLKFQSTTEVSTSAAQPGELGEDMLQMALRMASEISEEPVLDLEDSLNPAPIQPMPQEDTTEFSTIDQSSDILSNSPREAPRGRKGRRGRGGRGRPKRPRLSEESTIAVQDTVITEPKPAADANMVLKYTYGVNAWKHWVAQKNTLLEKTTSGNRGKVKLFKTDILACTTEELNYSLCLFVKEVRKPNGEDYAPDSIFYLCLGIQQYLYENGRIDDIFSSFYYEGFTDALNEVLAGYEITLNAHGLLVCRIEEEHLWESKQLGAHSPYILLNTLIYFNTKYFFLKTPEEHLRLSFSHIMKHWKRANGQPVTAKQPAQGQTKNVYLRYYAPTTSDPSEPGQKRKREETPVYEQAENTENPLRCPVKLYEFYLSKCPESIKHRNDVFYLLPERSCVPDSPVWYSTNALSLETMTKMLNRLRLVREIQEAHLHSALPHYGI